MLQNSEALIRRLEQFVRLTEDERALIDGATRSRARAVKARSDILAEGQNPEVVNLVISGWAYRYKMLEDGRRQILALLLPGDFCDLHLYLLNEMDHSVAALTQVIVCEMTRDVVERLLTQSSRVARAMQQDMLVNIAIQREWVVNLGQRTAFERLSHLFCEIFLRLRTVGLTDGPACDIPLTQNELGDATGLSTVHVNRTLKELRETGLIRLEGHRLTIPDLDALMVAALFNPSYLHLSQRLPD